MCQYGYIAPTCSGSKWWGAIKLERSGCSGNEHKMCEKGWKWVELGETAICPMWKKHQNLLASNNESRSVTKYGFLVRRNAQIVAPRAHRASGRHLGGPTREKWLQTRCLVESPECKATGGFRIAPQAGKMAA